MEDFRKAQKNKKWEEVEFVRGKENIQKENIKWIEDHFSNFNKKNNIMNVLGKKVEVKIKDTIIAIERMGKKKATSIDELMDIIF